MTVSTPYTLPCTCNELLIKLIDLYSITCVIYSVFVRANKEDLVPLLLVFFTLPCFETLAIKYVANVSCEPEAIKYSKLIRHLHRDKVLL